VILLAPPAAAALLLLLLQQHDHQSLSGPWRRDFWPKKRRTAKPEAAAAQPNSIGCVRRP